MLRQVWQADPLVQAAQVPGAAAATQSGDDDAALSAVVRQALLGDAPLATAAADAGRTEEAVMHDADDTSADGGAAAATAAAGVAVATGDTQMVDSAATDSMARLSLSGESGSGSGAARPAPGVAGEPPGDAEQRRRHGLFLLEEPVTWSALQPSCMDRGRGMLSFEEPGGRAVLAKKQGVLCTLCLNSAPCTATAAGSRYVQCAGEAAQGVIKLLVSTCIEVTFL